MHNRSSVARARTISQRGVTMVELMAVVVIVGILATIAQTTVKRYIAASKTTEATGTFVLVKIGQEAYKDETHSYLNVSPGLESKNDFYPNNPSPGQKKMNFAGDGPGKDEWATLGVRADAPVAFVYACVAGPAGNVPSPGSDITVTNWPATLGKPWYIAKARADLDGDGVNTVFVSSSFANEMFSANN